MKIIKTNKILILLVCCLQGLIRSSDIYSETLGKINNLIEYDPNFKNYAYLQTSFLQENLGEMHFDSENFQFSMEYIYNMFRDVFDEENVRKEEVKDLHYWKRREEDIIVKGRRYEIKSLANSVGADLTTEAIFVESLADLKEKHKDIEGKIVIIDSEYLVDLEVTEYVRYAPSRASKYGAKALLVSDYKENSFIDLELESVLYDEKNPKIPVAIISWEVAAKLKEIMEKEKILTIDLFIDNPAFEKVNSFNIVAEIKGTEHPDEIILVSSYLGCKNISRRTGINKNFASLMVNFEAVRALISLGIKPLRTIRFLVWISGENDLNDSGVQRYIEAHENEMHNHMVVINTSKDILDIDGFWVTGHDLQYATLRKIGAVYFHERDNPYFFTFGNGLIHHTNVFYNKYNIPVIKNRAVLPNSTKERKCNYPKTPVDVINKIDLDNNVKQISGVLYILANITFSIPKN